MDAPLDIISTVDSLFYRKLKAISPEARYDFELLESWLTPEIMPRFLSAEELISEIENFLFGGGISEEQYLKEIVPRTGLRRRLSRRQRQTVWAIRQAFVEHMESCRTYTKNYGRLKLYQYLKSHREDRKIRDISCLFLDEVQDLTPVALNILRELTRGAMVMARDVGQSIYSYQWPFSRTDIRLRGTTRILRTNFRNTIQVYNLAESFRRRSIGVVGAGGEADPGVVGAAGAAGAGEAAGSVADAEPSADSEAAAYSKDTAGDSSADSTTAACTDDQTVDTRESSDTRDSRFAAEPGSDTRLFPFRVGPLPECYVAESETELKRLLLEKVLVFIEELGYDPENLCILVPRNREIDSLQKYLEREALQIVDISSDEFSFRTANKIRVSTLHSSKGLDFPVVLLYLPYLHRRRQYDEEQTEKLLRNLVYVGITRAMDNVNAFVVPGADPVLRDLVASFGDSTF